MKVFLVGGAVRDVYMGRTPSDRDYVVVGATPEDMLREGYEQVGASFPVFLHPDTGEEYALARVERKVGEGYHGFETSTDNVTLEEDLSRRDFTINAMAIDMDTADLIDPFGGLKDIKAKALRHVGPAFREDPLRVVRLARFLARFTDFTAADETFVLAQEMVRRGELNELPWERFAAEVVKVLDTCTPDGCFTFFDALDKLGCGNHVTFFAGVDLMKAARAAKVVARFVPSVRPALLGAVAFTDPERAEHVGGSVARDVRLILNGLQDKEATPELLFEALKRSGAWAGGATFHTLLGCLKVEHTLGTTYPFYDSQLVHAEAVTTHHAQLGAELAQQGVDGAAIGRAIRDARLKSLRQLDL